MANVTAGGWLAVLNALAGTSGLGENAAANAYAGTKGMSLLYALNAKYYGSTTFVPSTAQSLHEINAICNLLASTSGLEAVQALSILANSSA